MTQNFSRKSSRCDIFIPAMREPTASVTKLSPNQKQFAHALITKEELHRFKDVAFQEYGIRLTDEQAYEQATALVTLFDTLLKYHLAFGRQNDTITDEVI